MRWCSRRGLIIGVVDDTSQFRSNGGVGQHREAGLREETHLLPDQLGEHEKLVQGVDG